MDRQQTETKEKRPFFKKRKTRILSNLCPALAYYNFLLKSQR